MAGKQYDVIRPFTRTDPRTGADAIYDVGGVYSGPVDKPYLLGPDGPDGQGPLIAEKSVPTPTPATSASDSSNKEK